MTIQGSPPICHLTVEIDGDGLMALEHSGMWNHPYPPTWVGLHLNDLFYEVHTQSPVNRTLNYHAEIWFIPRRDQWCELPSNAPILIEITNRPGISLITISYSLAGRTVYLVNQRQADRFSGDHIPERMVIEGTSGIPGQTRPISVGASFSSP